MIAQAMEERGIKSVRALEEACGLPEDSVRDLMRGRVKRNRTVKMKRLGRVASVLGVSQEDLGVAAGLLFGEGSRYDLGPMLQQKRRIALARGGDPELCTYPLGILAAWEQGRSGAGITRMQHDAGCIFAALHHRVMGTNKSRARSCLFRVLYAETIGENIMEDPEERERRDADHLESDARARRAYNRALDAFVRSQDTLGYNLVRMTAVDEMLPPRLFRWADDDGSIEFPNLNADRESAEPEYYVDRFLRWLRPGLDMLSGCFHIKDRR
jgi:hypothetical protein